MSGCPIALLSVFVKVINEIKEKFLSSLFSRRCLAYAYFLLNVNLDMLIKKKHVFTDIENLKLEKYYDLFRAIFHC